MTRTAAREIAVHFTFELGFTGQTAEALLAQAQELRERIADLDAREPADMMSAQYERWAARHEALEDALDDILDLLDE